MVHVSGEGGVGGERRGYLYLGGGVPVSRREGEKGVPVSRGRGEKKGVPVS